MPLAKTGEPLRVPGVRIVKLIKMFCAYILKSDADGTHYYGHTNDLIERLKKHTWVKSGIPKAGGLGELFIVSTLIPNQRPIKENYSSNQLKDIDT